MYVKLLFARAFVDGVFFSFASRARYVVMCYCVMLFDELFEVCDVMKDVVDDVCVLWWCEELCVVVYICLLIMM